MTKKSYQPELIEDLITATQALRTCVVKAKGGFAVDDWKARSALMMTNTALSKLDIPLEEVQFFEAEVTGPDERKGSKIAWVPYPIGSIVRYDTDKMLIEKQSFGNGIGVSYALAGAKELGTEGEGCAWIDHEELTLLQLPTLETFTMLIIANEDNRDEEDLADDDDDDSNAVNLTRNSLRKLLYSTLNVPLDSTKSDEDDETFGLDKNEQKKVATALKEEYGVDIARDMHRDMTFDNIFELVNEALDD